jgi:hypothetical protein
MRYLALARRGKRAAHESRGSHRYHLANRKPEGGEPACKFVLVYIQWSNGPPYVEF